MPTTRICVGELSKPCDIDYTRSLSSFLMLVYSRKKSVGITLTVKHLSQTAQQPPLPEPLHCVSYADRPPFHHSPPSPQLLPQLILGGVGVITVLFHNGNIGRNHSLGTRLHKAERLLLGWRVEVIEKDAADAPPLPAMRYEEVVVTPRTRSRGKP